MLWIFIIIAIIAIDQLTKYIVFSNLAPDGSITLINDVFNIIYSRNKGAAWGILQNGRIFFIILTPIVIGVLAYLLKKSQHRLLSLSISLIIGGAVGNYIERLLWGSVTDFLDVHIGSYIFPTFNVADSAVVVGTILLASYLLFIYKEKDKV